MIAIRNSRSALNKLCIHGMLSYVFFRISFKSALTRHRLQSPTGSTSDRRHHPAGEAVCSRQSSEQKYPHSWLLSLGSSFRLDHAVRKQHAVDRTPTRSDRTSYRSVSTPTVRHLGGTAAAAAAEASLGREGGAPRCGCTHRGRPRRSCRRRPASDGRSCRSVNYRCPDSGTVGTAADPWPDGRPGPPRFDCNVWKIRQSNSNIELFREG